MVLILVNSIFADLLFTRENTCVLDGSVFVEDGRICFEYSSGGTDCDRRAEMSDFIPMYVYQDGICRKEPLMDLLGVDDPNVFNLILGSVGILSAVIVLWSLP